MGDFLEKKEQKIYKEWGSKNGLVNIKISKRNIIRAAFVLLPAIIIFIIAPYLVTRSYVVTAGSLEPIRALMFIIMPLFAASAQFFEFNFSQKVKRRIASITLVVMPLYCTVLVELINHSKIWSEGDIGKILANYIVYFMITAFIYSLSRRAYLSTVIIGSFAFLYGTGNYFVTAFRGVPILPWDVKSIGTAMGMSGNYEYVITDFMAFFMILNIIIFSWLSIMRPSYKEDSQKRKVIERTFSAVVVAVIFVLVIPFNGLKNLGVFVWPWEQKTSTSITGCAAGFIENIQFMMIDIPEGYSVGAVKRAEKQIEEMEDPAKLGNPEKQPHIIAVMCESMTDVLSTNPDLILSEDNMPFIHSLQENNENVISGFGYASVFAGNTCNSEYEFLTGNSMSVLPTGSIPYQQYIRSPKNSLVNVLKDYGYQTVAIHPADAKNWHRDEVYDFLGFDEFVDDVGFKSKVKWERGFHSDETCYDEVILRYKERDKDKPFFSFVITIANHAGYTTQDYENTIEIASGSVDNTTANQYLTATKASDDGFKKLIKYYEKEKEPVVIVFFGDHWPYTGSDEQMAELLGFDEYPTDNKEEFIRRQQVPYLIWANYPLSQPEVQDISLNYLSGLLMRSAGLELTPYMKYLQQLSESLPVVTDLITMDSLGNIYWPDEKTPYGDLLNEYGVLQYNNVFESGKSRIDSIFNIANEEE